MARCFHFLRLSCALLVVGMTPAVSAQERQRMPPWVAPERVFALEISPGWQVVLNDKDPSTVEFRHAAADASLFVRRMKVPAGAHPRQLLLNALEHRLRTLPGFKEGPRRDVQIAGLPGAEVAGVYYFQGNIQYPRAVEEIFVVRGEEAFNFHFECFEAMSAQLAPDLDRFYRTFIPRPPPGFGTQAPPDAGQRGLVDTDGVVF